MLCFSFFSDFLWKKNGFFYIYLSYCREMHTAPLTGCSGMESNSFILLNLNKILFQCVTRKSLNGNVKNKISNFFANNEWTNKYLNCRPQFWMSFQKSAIYIIKITSKVVNMIFRGMFFLQRADRQQFWRIIVHHCSRTIVHLSSLRITNIRK